MAWEQLDWIRAAAGLGAGVSVGFAAIGSAIGEGYAAGIANQTVSYRPKLAGDILKTMLVGQAVAETSGIFGLVIAVVLLFTSGEGQPTLAGWAYLAAGLSMGLAGVGSGVGSGFPAGGACRGIGRQPTASGPITTIMLVGASVSQSPTIYGFLVSLLLLFKQMPEVTTFPALCALLGSGLAMGFGAVGPGIGLGIAAENAVDGVARNPENVELMTRTMLIGQAVTESTSIYSLVVALLLILGL